MLFQILIVCGLIESHLNHCISYSGIEIFILGNIPFSVYLYVQLDEYSIHLLSSWVMLGTK